VLTHYFVLFDNCNYNQSTHVAQQKMMENAKCLPTNKSYFETQSEWETTETTHKDGRMQTCLPKRLWHLKTENTIITHPLQRQKTMKSQVLTGKYILSYFTTEITNQSTCVAK